ncbi:MAG: chromosome segregation protein SMC [Clostridia bacterium]|nr:chromosome segregation protein SMC [Clostridia bacterium]
MYLKTLEMTGFKSFPDKTKLNFENTEGNSAGVTVIVGPNGSGKSNISDAMRWVLGEISSKELRGSKMEDVIFGGADSRRPMGYAEVSVTFDNRDPFQRLECEFDEVTVTRRYYRGGESEYFINKRACRLKDIYTLFLNTGVGRDGYSIIGQGRIADIVSRKSDERRTIFEDASGIAKYRLNKNDAERRLANAQDNLEKVMLVFNELEAEIGPLENEAKKAKRAIELMEQKKEVDIRLWLYDTDRIRREVENARRALDLSKLELDNLDDAIRGLKVQYDRMQERAEGEREASRELLGQKEALSEEKHALELDINTQSGEQRRLSGNAEASRRLMAESERQIGLEKASCEEHEKKERELKANLEELEAGRKKALSEQTAANEAFRDLNRELDESLEQINELIRQLSDVQARIAVCRSAAENAEQQNQDYDREVEAMAQKLEELRTEAEKQKKQYDAYVRDYEDNESKRQTLAKRAEELRAEREKRTEASHKAAFERDSVASRLATIRNMEKNYEGFGNAVKRVMQDFEEGRIRTRDGRPAGTVFGPLSSVIKVEDAYIAAMDSALGNSLSHVVVENEETAKAAIEDLKRADAGRTTFLPVTSMQPQTPTKEMEDARRHAGYIGVASELVQCEAKFRGVIGSLLGRTLVFDTLDHASEMARAEHFRVKVVTLDGQQINAGGSFTGGSFNRRGSVLERAHQIRQLESELETLKAAAEKAEGERKECEEKLGQAVSELQNADMRRFTLEKLRDAKGREADRAAGATELHKSRMDDLAQEFSRLVDQRARSEEEMVRLEEQAGTIQSDIDRRREVRQQKYEESQDASDSAAEAMRRVQALELDIQSAEKDADVERRYALDARGRLAGLEQQIRERRADIAECERLIRQSEEQVNGDRAKIAQCEEKIKDLIAQMGQYDSAGAEFQTRMNQTNERITERMNEKENVIRLHTQNEEKLARLEETQDKLSTQLWDEHGLTRAQVAESGLQPATKEEHAELEKIRRDCANKLRNIGHVDLGAAEKFTAKKARYDEMKAQIDDLNAAREDLLKVIEGLESGMKEAFTAAFNQINENFASTFTELFGGGVAELSLTDPDNILESGIEIKAAPPGKIIKNLVQLSGGEQAFVGIALFFAILKVNPTPFCFLDEIEAALDEVNVERLAQYIKKYTDGTQFILITHRRGTMAAADRLYGVTMPEHGISKIFMLDVGSVQKNEKGEWNGLFS